MKWDFFDDFITFEISNPFFARSLEYSHGKVQHIYKNSNTEKFSTTTYVEIVISDIFRVEIVINWFNYE